MHGRPGADHRARSRRARRSAKKACLQAPAAGTPPPARSPPPPPDRRVGNARHAPISTCSSATNPLNPGRPIEAMLASTNVTAANGSARARRIPSSFVQLPGVGPVIDHPSHHGEQQPRDDPVREHLQHGAAQPHFGQGHQPQQHKAHVTHTRVTDHELEILLHQRHHRPRTQCPTTASTAISVCQYLIPAGNSTIATRRHPYAPSFITTPASNIDAAVGAATWPVGAQVWNGHKPAKIAKSRRTPAETPSAGTPRGNGHLRQRRQIERRDARLARAPRQTPRSARPTPARSPQTSRAPASSRRTPCRVDPQIAIRKYFGMIAIS